MRNDNCKKGNIKETSIKFAKWCASYNIANQGDKWISKALCSWGHKKAYTLEELFDKFIKENNELERRMD